MRDYFRYWGQVSKQNNQITQKDYILKMRTITNTPIYPSDPHETTLCISRKYNISLNKNTWKVEIFPFSCRSNWGKDLVLN